MGGGVLDKRVTLKRTAPPEAAARRKETVIVGQ